LTKVTEDGGTQFRSSSNLVHEMNEYFWVGKVHEIAKQIHHYRKCITLKEFCKMTDFIVRF